MADQTQDPPELLEIELGVHTKNYRESRHALWALLRKQRDDYITSAKSHGATESAAAEAAARHIRGEVNMFIGELLTHARKSDVLSFLTTAPREWGIRGELLLDEDPLVPNLVARSYPIVAWVDKIEALDKAVAEDRETWTTWLGARLLALGDASASATEHAFGVAEKLAEGVGEAVGGLGKGVGDGIGNLGKGAGDLGKGIGTAVMIGVGVVSVGAVVIGGIWLLRRRS